MYEHTDNYTVFHTKLVAVTLLILNRFSVFVTLKRLSGRFAAECLLKIPPHLICVAALPAIMSENERQLQTNAVINDKLQDTVVTYLRCRRIVNNQIKAGLLRSLQVKQI